MKERKFLALVDEIDEFIGEHNHNNHHPLFKADIIKHFTQFYKEKPIKKALKRLTYTDSPQF